MMNMLADQFYHQTGDNITINRMELAEMLTKQTMHGMGMGVLISGIDEESSTPEIPDNSDVEEIPQMAGTLEALDKLTLKTN